MLYPHQSQALRRRLEELTQEHRDLDIAINQLRDHPDCDEFVLARMKKRKLMLKDMITRLHSELIPNLNA